MKYQEKYYITCHDIDRNNNIKPSFLVRYMQETANHQMRDRRPSYNELFDQGLAFIITRMYVQIFEQLHQYDEIEVNTWRCDAKAATFPRCWEVLRDGEVVAKAYSEWTVANRNTGKLCKTDEVDISEYEHDEVLALDLPKRFRFGKDAEFVHVDDRKIFYSDCDMNMHMNNTNYPDMLWNYIPDIENKEVTSINIRFMREAAIGKTVSIGMREEDLALANDPKAEEIYGFKSHVDGETNVDALIGVKTL